ncbi:hypothetical protein V2A60_001867 [Cordyceps javanica]
MTFNVEIQYQEHLITEHNPSEKVELSPVFASQALQSHIGGHMKEIALLTLQKLPSLEDEQNMNIESDELSDDEVGPVLERFRGSMYSVLDDDEDLVFQDGDSDAETINVDLDLYHPDELTSMANLVSTYKNQGRLEEAERLGIQVLEIRKTKLGADHPNTLASMANLVSIYKNKGRLREAEMLEMQVLEICKTKLGADHPDTLTSMANLASIHRYQGWFGEAEKLEVAAAGPTPQQIANFTPEQRAEYDMWVEMQAANKDSAGMAPNADTISKLKVIE